MNSVLSLHLHAENLVFYCFLRNTFLVSVLDWHGESLFLGLETIVFLMPALFIN